MNLLHLKRDRSPMSGSNGDRQETVRERSDRERSRRGDRPSRFGPLSSSGANVGNRKGSAEKRIFVSNVAYEYTWQDLKDLFRDEVGTVSYVELFVDEQKKPRGCGIIEFESADSVQKAVDKMHRFELKGRKLVVKEDFDVIRDSCGRPMKNIGGSNMGGGGGGSMGGGGGGMGGGGGSLMGGSMGGSMGGDGLMGSGGGRDMRSLTSRLRDDQLANWEANSAALSSSLTSLGQAAGAGATQWGNTYGLSPQFLEDLWINGPLVTRVFVANLDYKVDRKKLKEVFKMAGRVINAELHMDRDGKSRGFGVIQYEHPVEAVQAISMFHNHSLYDRKMTVRMDRQDNKADLPMRLPEGLQSVGMGLGTNGAPLLDVSRNLPNLTQVTASTVPAASVDLSGNLTAAALSNAVNTSSLAGLSHSSGLQVGLGGLGNGLLGSALGGAGGLSGLTATLPAGGFGSSALGGGTLSSLSASNPFGGGNMLGGGSLLGGGSFGGAPSGGGGFGSGTTSGGGSFGSMGRDFEALSAALKGAGYRGDTAPERDFRGGQGAMGRGAMGGGLSQANTAGAGGMAGNGTQGSDTVIVKNLPATMTWQTLRDKFRDVGDIKYAEMRGKDVGLVRFNKERDAERAVYIMDRKRIDNRVIEVALFN